MSTRIVDPTVATSEWVRYGPAPDSTSRNSASVGLNTNLGGQVSAADSGLNAVITIQSTGRKNAIPTTHATIPQPTFPGSSRNLCGPGRTAVALKLLPPRTGRRGRTS